MLDGLSIDGHILQLHRVVEANAETVRHADGDAYRVNDANAGRRRELDVQVLCADVGAAVERNLARQRPHAFRLDGFIKPGKVPRAIRLVASRARAAWRRCGRPRDAASQTDSPMRTPP